MHALNYPGREHSWQFRLPYVCIHIYIYIQNAETSNTYMNIHVYICIFSYVYIYACIDVYSYMYINTRRITHVTHRAVLSFMIVSL